MLLQRLHELRKESKQLHKQRKRKIVPPSGLDEKLQRPFANIGQGDDLPARRIEDESKNSLRMEESAKVTASNSLNEELSKELPPTEQECAQSNSVDGTKKNTVGSEKEAMVNKEGSKTVSRELKYVDVMAQKEIGG